MNKSMRKALGAALLIGVGLVAFQNCSQSGFISTTGAPTPATQTGAAAPTTPTADAPKFCTPGQTQSCSDNLGSGSQTCNAEGSAYGACKITSCKSKYTLFNNTCVQSCFFQMSGDGSVANPFQIKNETDFLCSNQMQASRVSGSNWILKSNLKFDHTTYPVVNGVALRKFDPSQFILFSTLWNGSFEGDYHEITYTVNCNLEPDHCAYFDASRIKKDIAVFGSVNNSTIQHLSVKFDYVDRDANGNVSPTPNKATTQYATGGVMESHGGKLIQFAASGTIMGGAQTASAVMILDGSGLPNSGHSVFNQVYGKVTGVGSASTNFSALATLADYAQITNSQGYVDAKSPGSYGTGLTYGLFLSLPSPYQGTTSQALIENSYVWVRNSSNAANCLPMDFSGQAQTPVYNQGVVLKNSFWTGPVTCDKTSLYPEAQLPVPTSDYATILTQRNWDQTIWKTGADGLPQLKWLDLIKSQ